MIYPRCKQDQNQVYISADGLVIPCCWIGNLPSLEEYKSLHQEYLQDLNFLQNPLDKILQDSRYQKISQSWNTDHPFSACVQYCSKPQPAAKSDKMQGTNHLEKIKLKNK